MTAAGYFLGESTLLFGRLLHNHFATKLFIAQMKMFSVGVPLQLFSLEKTWNSLAEQIVCWVLSLWWPMDHDKDTCLS